MSELPKAKVAIVTRTKNRPVLLRRAIDSILSQTYDDYVVVVVNDAGERAQVEECVDAVAERAAGRIHVVHNETSNGREAAMNTGLRNSDSPYVVIHDDDDTWAPQFLEKTVAHLDEHDEGGVAVRTAVVYEQVDGERITTERQEVLASDMHDVTLFEMIRRNYVPPISLLYRREVHGTVGEYDESLPVLADWDFNLRMLGNYDVGFIDGEPLAFWHHRENSTGDLGNSVIAAADDHSSFDRTIRNKYLREEIQRAQNLGSLLYLTEINDRERKLGQIRHEQNLNLLHNINNQAAKLSNDFDSRLHEVNMVSRERTERSTQQYREIGRQLAEVNRNLVTQNNRFVAQIESLTSRLAELEELVYSQTPRQRLKSWKTLVRRKGAGAVRRAETAARRLR